MVLVDTSVWVDFLRGTSNARTQYLDELLEAGDAALCDVVFSELCFGAKNSKELRSIKEYFGAIRIFEHPVHWHIIAGEMGFKLRRSGHKPFLADILVAQTAIANNATLLSSDKDFLPFVELFGLSLI